MIYVYLQALPARSKIRMNGVLQEWNEVLAKDDKVWDQNAFNDIFRQHIEVNSPSTGLRTFMYAPCRMPHHYSSSVPHFSRMHCMALPVDGVWCTLAKPAITTPVKALTPWIRRVGDAISNDWVYSKFSP